MSLLSQLWCQESIRPAAAATLLYFTLLTTVWYIRFWVAQNDQLLPCLMQHPIQKFEDGCGDRLDYNWLQWCKWAKVVLLLIRLVPACLHVWFVICGRPFRTKSDHEALHPRHVQIQRSPFFLYCFGLSFPVLWISKTHGKHPHLLLSNDRGESTSSYRWTGWVWGIITTGWSSRLQGESPIVFAGVYGIYFHITLKKNQTIATGHQLDLETLGLLTEYARKRPGC
jgi:hypothetical protein